MTAGAASQQMCTPQQTGATTSFLERLEKLKQEEGMPVSTPLGRRHHCTTKSVKDMNERASSCAAGSVHMAGCGFFWGWLVWWLLRARAVVQEGRTAGAHPDIRSLDVGKPTCFAMCAKPGILHIGAIQLQFILFSSARPASHIARCSQVRWLVIPRAKESIWVCLPNR